MDELVLTTDAKRRFKGDLLIIGVLFAIITAVCAYVLLLGSGWQSFLLTELLVALALGWTLYRSCKNGAVTLHFKGDSLCISYKDGRKYNVSDVDRSYFKLVQTKKEKEIDMGSLHIESTNFRVLHIKSFSQLEKYMQSHFEGEKKSIYYFDEDDED